MTIAEAREKCKAALAKAPRDVLIFSILVASSSLAFGLGYGAGLEARPGGEVFVGNDLATSTGPFVASKFGTKYYLTSCSGAQGISSTNKVFFSSRDAAERAGYTPSESCRGL